MQVDSGEEGEVHFRNIKVKELAPKKSYALTDLFESGDFSSWSNADGGPVGDGWGIDHGVVFRGGQRPGSVNTVASYQDFDPSFEWKVSKGGNSGIKYSVHGDKAWYRNLRIREL